jgi:glutamate-ammonia-ligase adenylyltransferase
LAWSDNIRILETLEATGRLPEEDCRRLRDAYIAFRGAAHRSALTREAGRGRDADYHQHRQAVIALWQRLLEPPEVA